MAASLKDPGSIPGGGPKRFHDSFNFVFYIVGECISCAGTDLTCQYFLSMYHLNDTPFGTRLVLICAI